MNKKTIIILITSIISFILVLTVGSYAYLRAIGTQTTSNTISTLTCLNVGYSDDNGYINMENAYPISDAEGLANAPTHTITITNNCSTPVSVQINLERLKQTITNTLGLDKVKVAFYRTGITGYSGALLSSKSNGTKITSTSESSKILTYSILSSQEQRSYTLRLWVTEAATNADMGKVYKGKIAIVGSPIEYTAKNLPGWNAPSGTLLNAIENGNYIYASPMTTPGRAAASSATEGIISNTTDDYGTSYYFRGRIDDNYVVFANMCWKIVRVTGNDGTNGEYNNGIKLIVYNYNPDGLANPCIQIKNGNAFAVGYDATTNGQAGKSAYNSTKDSNTYVGFMTGTRRSSTYEAEHANTSPSTILTNIKKWYDLKLTGYSDYLADVIWCNDISTSSGTGIGNANTYYGAYGRMNTAASANPTLICPDSASNDVNYKKLGKFTSSALTDGGYGNGALNGYKIGLATIDELGFTGGAINTNNSVYYMYENASSAIWWMISPSRHYSSSANVYAFQTAGQLSTNGLSTNTAYGLRPMIALKSDVTVNANSDGTATNPYIIQGRVGVGE